MEIALRMYLQGRFQSCRANASACCTEAVLGGSGSVLIVKIYTEHHKQQHH